MAAKSEYHDNWPALQAASGGAWDRVHQPHLFDRFAWWRDVQQLCLPDRRPLFAIANDRDTGGRCILPLMQRDRFRHQSLGHWYNFTWRPVFVNAPDDVAKLALLRQIAISLPKQAQNLTLSPIPDEDGSANLLETAFQQAGWLVTRSECDENHVLHVNGRSFDDYWQGRPGQMRSTVKRKSKKNDVQIRIESAFSEEVWTDYESVYAQSWKPREGNPAFLKHLAKTEAEHGCTRIGIAYIDGAPVAAQFWTVENGMALIHKLAHTEASLAASPGTLLSAALFQHVIDIDRVDLIDFGTGNDRYKLDWMEENRPRYRLELYWPRSPLTWPYIAKNWLSGLVASRQSD